MREVLLGRTRKAMSACVRKVPAMDASGTCFGHLPATTSPAERKSFGAIHDPRH